MKRKRTGKEIFFVILLIFFAMALFAALLYLALAGTGAIWAALGVLVLAFLAVNLLFVLFIALYALLLPRLEPGEGVERQRAICRRLCACVARWLCNWARLRVQVLGRETLPEGRYLFVCNHRSMYDPLSVMAYLPEQNISFISKPSNLKIPVVGVITRYAGFLAIDREDNREALKSILLAADYLKRGLCSIGNYPEGTRSKTGELLPFHAGSFKIVQRAAVPVVVACVSGGEQVKRRWPWRATKLRLEIVETIDVKTVKSCSTNELAERARTSIEARLQEIEGEEKA